MQQECLYFHTEKIMDETNDILQNEGMEIIFKADSIWLDYNELNEAEKSCWIISVERYLESNLNSVKESEIDVELFIEQNKSVKKSLIEIINLLKNSVDQSLSGKYDQLFKEMYVYNKKLKQFDQYGRRGLNFSRLGINSQVSCSCLIAKQGNNIVRYLSFEDDPVLSITGPEANNLKSTLESKF